MAAYPDLETYFASIPEKNRYKLDKKLDFDHGGVEMDLGTITSSMDEWEGSIAEQLRLTRHEIEAIRTKYPGDLPLQTRAALQKWQDKFGPNATYRALITAFVKARKGNCAEAVCDVLRESDLGSERRDVLQADPIQRYATYLKGVYNSSLVTSDKFPNLTCSEFINLALIKSDHVSRSKADEFTEATLHGHVDEILQKKEPIKLEEVLKPVAEGQRNMKCVYMQGAPGVGKSTCVGELCRRWDEIDALKSYSLVILLRLREKRVQEAQNVKDLCYHDNKEVQQAVAAEIEACEGKDVLFVLDGFDELPASLQKSSIFVNLIRGTYLSHCTVLVTSRPSATADLYKARPKIHKQIEVIGFTQTHIKQYANAFFASQPDILADFLIYISTHPGINSLMYIPLNCAIVAETYRYNRRIGRPIPQTMTQLYIEMSLTLLQRHLGEDNPLAEQLPEKLQDLPPKLNKPFSVLSKLAFEGLERNEVIFHKLPTSFVHFGFMNSPTELYMGKKALVSHSFLHLTLQEFLAAFHISQLSPSDQKDVFEKHFTKGNWSVVWRFVAGLTGFSAIGWQIVQSKIEAYYKNVYPFLNFSTDPEGLQPFMIQCLYEAQDTVDIGSVLGDSVVTFTGQLVLTALDCYAVGYCITNSKCMWKLNMEFNERLGGTMIEMLKHVLCSAGTSLALQKECTANILSLNISLCGLNSTDFNLLADIIPFMINLEELNISANQAGDGGLVKLFCALTHLRCLQELDMSTVDVGCADIEALSSLISPSSSLKELSIGDIRLSCETKELILKTVFSPSSLHTLTLKNLSGANWTASIVKLVEENNNLILLQSFGEYSSVVTALCKNSHLKVLMITYSLYLPKSIDDATSCMAQMLRTNKTLETVISSALSLDEILMLNTSLQFNHTLKEFHVRKPDSLDFIPYLVSLDPRIKFM